MTRSQDALEHVMSLAGSDTWSDHHGTIEVDGVQLLIAESYAERITATVLLELEKFCRLIGASCQLSDNSHHFPGRTLRIIVSQNSAIANEYRKREATRNLSAIKSA